MRELVDERAIDRYSTRAGELFRRGDELVGACGHLTVVTRSERLQPAGQREDDEDQHDEAGRAEARRAVAAVTDTTAEKRNHEEDDE